MPINRRQFLLSASGALVAPALLAGPARPQVVIVGGGWGGLAAARALAADCAVTLLERNPGFISLPLSNRWLVGLDDGRRLQQDYRAAAAALGYRFVQTEVHDLDFNQQSVASTAGNFAYDWLIVAAGISENDSALFAGDGAAATFTRQHFASAYVTGPELEGLKNRLARFAGGEFLLTLPPAPYRCPPAPYERAMLIAHQIKSRGLKARLTVVDPNAPWPGYQRVFSEAYRDQINYLPNTRLRQLDPYRRIATLDVDDVAFDAAIIMPPQQAASLCQKAGLTGRDSAWAAVHPQHFQFSGDDKVFVIGDSVGPVSPLFGHYPKTGQLASRMGQIVASEILGRINGKPSSPALPESTCYAYLNREPAQLIRIEARYRRRGDGALVQQVEQQRENNPQGEDDAWLNARHSELFGAATLL